MVIMIIYRDSESNSHTDSGGGDMIYSVGENED